VKIILDENLPKGLVRLLAPRRVTTVQEEGYAGYKNGRLIAELEGGVRYFYNSRQKSPLSTKSKRQAPGDYRIAYQSLAFIAPFTNADRKRNRSGSTRRLFNRGPRGRKRGLNFVFAFAGWHRQITGAR
jgi:hypothetical protein